MRTTVGVLDSAGFGESQKSGLRKKFKLYLRKRGNVAIDISEED
jgi:hypothetical protein